VKSIHTLAFLLLFMLSIASFAATTNKEITLYDTTKIGAAELKPGNYKVAWKGNGPDVDVDFLKNNKVVASATAKLGNARSEVNSVHTTHAGDGGFAILEELDFKNTQLVFAGADEHSGN